MLAGEKLPPKLSKQVTPSCDGVKCIGVEIHGTLATVGVSAKDIHTLCRRTALLLRGSCTGKDMERLLGHWTWVCLCRRSAFAIFCSIYRFCEAARFSNFTIWPSVRRELQTAIALAPLMFSSLAAP